MSGYLWWVFGQTSDSGKEVAVSALALLNIVWIDSVENAGVHAFVSEMVTCPSPVELLAFFVLPVHVTLVLSAIDEQSLWPVRESIVVPGHLAFDDVLVRNVSESSLAVRELISISGIRMRNVVEKQRLLLIFCLVVIEPETVVLFVFDSVSWRLPQLDLVRHCITVALTLHSS